MTTSGAVQPTRIPQSMKELNQWGVWAEGKVPRDGATGKPIAANRPAEWSSFNDALMDYQLADGYQGIGFCFTEEDDFVGIDLDDCFAEDGHALPWLGKVLAFFPHGYIERSPSGSGLHIIVKGTKPGDKCKKVVKNKIGARLGEIEMYSHSRYFTVTGNLYDPAYSEPVHAQDSIDGLYNYIWGSKKAATKLEVKPAATPTKQEGVSPTDIIQLIEGSNQHEKFRLLTKGSFEDIAKHYGDDHSAAMYALTSIVAWYTADFSVLDRLFRGSALYSRRWAPDGATGSRPHGKWAALGESTFREVRKAYESEGNVYSSGAGRTRAEDDFTPAELTKERAKGEKDYEKHIELLLDLGEPRRDLLSGSLHYKAGKDWLPVFTKAVVSTLRGECQARGAAYKKTRVEDYLYRYEQSQRPQLLLDLPEWDGEDRLGFMCQRLEFSNVTKEVFEDIFKDWCAKLWQRIDNPTKVQNLCLLLSGNQGIGKDVWISSIFHSLGRYFSDFTMDGKFTKESEIGIVLARSLVLFISEFEKTESLDIGTLKDIITKVTYTSVRKYDRDASTLLNRCSVIGACNPSHIFRDVTGNRRFIFFRLSGNPGQAIRWDYPVMDPEFSLNCLAQIQALGEGNYRASSDSWDIITALQEQYTPENPEQDVVADFEAAVEQKVKSAFSNNHGIFRIHDLSDEFATLARNHGYPRRVIMGILKRAGCQYRSAKCRWYGTRAACKAGAETTELIENASPAEFEAY